MTLVGKLKLKMLLKNVIHFFTYCLELKSFSLFKTENGFTMLTFFPILIVVVLFGVIEDKLVKLQNRAARAILDVDFTVPLETMFTQGKWMTFPKRVVYHKAIQMYKTVCGDAPDYVKNDFVFTSEIHSRLLRSNSNFQLYTPRPNTELFRNAFIFSGTSIWNSIPQSRKTAPSVKHFKSLYLRWYIQSFESEFCVHDTIKCVPFSSQIITL